MSAQCHIDFKPAYNINCSSEGIDDPMLPRTLYLSELVHRVYLCIYAITLE